MRIGKTQWIGIIFFVLLVGADFIFFRGEHLFYFLMSISFIVLALPFVVNVVIGNKREQEKNERFLEFARNLAENVKGGTPIGQSIMNMSKKNFGNLTEHIKKLANQISLGIPISRAFQTFADDIGSNTVSRAVTLIREAENSGGKIDDILDSVAASIYQIEKLKKERKAAISNLVVQGYVIFFIFIGIMLIMQFKILPLTADVSSVGSFNKATAISGGSSNEVSPELVDKLTRPFLYLLILQGVFSGLAIGKLAEGTIKAGVKHSFIMTVTAFLVSTGAKLFL